MNEIEKLIWFSKLKLDYEVKRKIYFQYGLDNILKIQTEELYNFFTDSEVKEILKKEYMVDAKNEYNILKNKGIQIIEYKSNLYADSLKNIFDPPLVLFAYGNINLLNRQSVAIVGTRKCSYYGKNIAFNISKKLCERGICIVSGLAVGIDEIAHKGALSNTIAVLGSGIMNIYPIENIELARKIIKNGGLIISEYSIFEQARKNYFPARNRIISGLADAVVIVEAGKRSGSLITADFALEYGKEVYAVPGNILYENSIGTNNLIMDGAFPITNIDEFTKKIFSM